MNAGACVFVLRPLRRSLRRDRSACCRPAAMLPAGELAMCARMGVDPAAYQQAARTELIVAALLDGRLTPAQKTWAERQPLASLREYLDT